MNEKTIKLITAGLALSGTILAVGSTLTGIPSLPGWAVQSWPIIYGIAIAFDRVAHALIAPAATPPSTPTAGTAGPFDALKGPKV